VTNYNMDSISITTSFRSWSSFGKMCPNEPDGLVDDEDIPILDSWTERTAEDLWVRGDEVEQSLPVDLEFAPWHEEELVNCHGISTDGCHRWTDGSRRISAAFGWSLRGYNDQGKQTELECNKGCLGEFEAAFDGEIEAIADIMECAIDNQLPGDPTIHSDVQAAISRAGHTGTGPGQDRAIRVVKAVQRQLKQGWRTMIEWVPEHTGQSPRWGCSFRETKRTNINCVAQRADLKTLCNGKIDKGKESITPPAPKKSFLDRASNRLAKTIAQIRTGHWLCAPYVKRVRKNREEQVSHKC
jgi:hypothetical protein